MIYGFQLRKKSLFNQFHFEMDEIYVLIFNFLAFDVLPLFFELNCGKFRFRSHTNTIHEMGYISCLNCVPAPYIDEGNFKSSISCFEQLYWTGIAMKRKRERERDRERNKIINVAQRIFVTSARTSQNVSEEMNVSGYICGFPRWMSFVVRMFLNGIARCCQQLLTAFDCFIYLYSRDNTNRSAEVSSSALIQYSSLKHTKQIYLRLKLSIFNLLNFRSF